MKVTAVALVNESTDHYARAYAGHLDIDQITAQVEYEFDDYDEVVYIDDFHHTELT